MSQFLGNLANARHKCSKGLPAHAFGLVRHFDNTEPPFLGALILRPPQTGMSGSSTSDPAPTPIAITAGRDSLSELTAATELADKDSSNEDVGASSGQIPDAIPSVAALCHRAGMLMVLEFVFFANLFKIQVEQQPGFGGF